MRTRGLGVVSLVLFLGCAGAGDSRVPRRAPDVALVPTNPQAAVPGAPLTPPAPTSPGAYNLAQLPVFSKVLFYVRENYFDKTRFNYKRMLLGALDFVQRDVPEILVDPSPAEGPREVTVTVSGQQRRFSIDRVDAPWSLRSKLQEIFRFVQPNLQPVADEQAPGRLLEIEMAIANGMLYTLDPHSILLDAETYADMHAPSDGKPIGGTGIVIALDPKYRIRIRRPIPDSPAARAGIKPGDYLVRIDDTSTLNMTLNEAVERLRGEVGSSVDLYLERANRSLAKKLSVTRAFIRPPAIDPPARVMTVPAGVGLPAAKIGYFRLQHFAANSASDVADALQRFEQQRVSGIVVDLRGNAGGLYEQAQKVADEFIESGILVSMVGVGGSQRRDESATRSDRKPKVPVAVLVDHQTAAASEIVAGALKKLDRGVIIGETTHGGGSVQVLFDIRAPFSSRGKSGNDMLGLKLTTAQFLIAGSTSIQGVGIAPDIETRPLLVQTSGEHSGIRLQPSRHRRSEADYEWHLENASVDGDGKSVETVSYLLPPRTDEQAEAESDQEPYLHDDFIIDFARDFLARARTAGRREILVESKSFLAKVRASEESKLASALEKLGLDWSSGPVAPAPQLQLTLQLVGGGAQIAAGGVARLRGVVKNVGSAAAFRVSAVLESDNPIFDENEMLFGKIAPGGSKAYDLSVKVPAASFTRTDVVSGMPSSERGVAVNTHAAEMILNIQGKPRPVFAYTYQTIDDPKGSNRDGQVQRGEHVTTRLTLRNIGAGASLHTEAMLRNRSGQDGILISAGQFDGGDLAPGATKSFSFVYEVRPDFKRDEYELELALADTVLDEAASSKLKVKIAGTGDVPTPLVGAVSPPVLTVSAPAVTTGDTVHIKGRAVADRLVRDIFVRVWNRNRKLPVKKVFYQANRLTGDRSTMEFEADVPVWAGSNLIQVFARETDEVQSLQTLVVLKRAASDRPSAL